jgi:hypothetical protein
LAINKYQPHLIVIPEDDANRQIAVEFAAGCQTNRLRVDTVGGGWTRTVDLFLRDYAEDMRRFTGRSIVLIVDSDGKPDRISTIKEGIPEDIASRVFVIGCFDEPEKMRTDLGSFETIGRTMAKECIEGIDSIWKSDHLRHNSGEMNRLKIQMCDLFRNLGR